MEGTVEEYRKASHDWQRLCAQKQKRIEELEKQIEIIRLLCRSESPEYSIFVERGFIILSKEGEFQSCFSTRLA